MTHKRADLLHAFPISSDPSEQRALGFDSLLEVEVRFPGQSRGFLARLRDPRGRSCFLDVGASLFTLAYRDVLEHHPPADGTPDVVVLRPGALATHVVPRMSRSGSRRRAAPAERPARPAPRPVARPAEPWEAEPDVPTEEPAEAPAAVVYAASAD